MENKLPYLNFRAAQKNDTDAVLALYKAVIGTPFCTWNEVYPGLMEINNDFETDSLFVLEADERIIGAISIVPENELDDSARWSSGRNAGEFARVVIHPDFQGRHLAESLVLNVLDVMKNRGYENVHISVVTENIPAQKTYRKLGFKTVGLTEMWGHRLYLCELPLDNS